MKSNSRVVRTEAIGIALASILLFLPTLSPSAAEKVHRIELVGGEKIEGIVIPASDCILLVQNEEVCVEIPLDRIAEVDGARDFASLLRAGDPPLLRSETYEEIRENGDVIYSSFNSRANESARIVDEIDWGLAPHEIPLLDNWKVFDPFGQELPLRVDDTPGGRKRAHVKLPRPVLPGETIRSAHRIVFKDLVKAEGGTLHYAHRGDYPEDRLVTKAIRLPHGATVRSVSPEPAFRFESDGSAVLVWKHFFAKGEIYPIEINYSLQR